MPPSSSAADPLQPPPPLQRLPQPAAAAEFVAALQAWRRLLPAAEVRATHWKKSWSWWCLEGAGWRLLQLLLPALLQRLPQLLQLCCLV